MDTEDSRIDRPSIVNLFEKMHSNVTKFKESINASPSPSRKKTAHQSQSQSQPCSCARDNSQRKLQSQFYSSQFELVSKAASLLKAEGNLTLSKLLTFMSEYLQKLVHETQRELLCDCKREKIKQNEQYLHKIAFLRDENHKFFRMIEEKNEECDLLSSQLQRLTQAMQSSNSNDSAQLPVTHRTHLSKNSSLSEVVCSSLNEAISSRAITSSASRVSEFRAVWPELMMPLNEGAHKAYFDPSPGDRRAHFNQARACLQQRKLNESVQLGFRRSKIFCGNCLIN